MKVYILVLLLLTFFPSRAIADQVVFLIDTSGSMQNGLCSGWSEKCTNQFEDKQIGRTYRILGRLLSDWPEEVGVSAVEWSDGSKDLGIYSADSLAYHFQHSWREVGGASFLSTAFKTNRLTGCAHHIIVTNEIPDDSDDFEKRLQETLTSSLSVTVLMMGYFAEEKNIEWFKDSSKDENYHVVRVMRKNDDAFMQIRDHVHALLEKSACRVGM